MQAIIQFFAGAFLCNCIPHLAAGLQGRAFPTPFARLRGATRSSPLLNVCWGLANVVAGLFALDAAPVAVGINAGFGIALAGALALGAYIATHFAKLPD